MTPEYIARTAYGALIAKAFAGRSDALAWAEQNSAVFPGCRIVRAIECGGRIVERTVWKHAERAAA